MRPKVFRFLLVALVLGCFSGQAYPCSGPFDVTCELGKAIKKNASDVGKTIQKDSSWISLFPTRAFLRGADLPPLGVGAYGLVTFVAKSAGGSDRDRLIKVCSSFRAYLSRQSDSLVATQDQMLTVWPLRHPDDRRAIDDSCEFAVDDYDLTAADAAIIDARKQRESVVGRGPFLIGWSPSNTRGVPDRLVLVYDMSSYESQDSFDHAFLFWKEKIIQDPALWRNGFSVEKMRLATRDFADRYGQEILDGVKFFGIK